MTQLSKKAFYIIFCGLLYAAAVLGASFKPTGTDQLKTAVAEVCAGTAGTTYGSVADFDLSDLTHLDYLNIPDDCNAQLAGIGSWNTGTIESLVGTFYGAEAFNQDLNGWDISAVKTLEETFLDAKAFNQDLNGWDISAVTTLLNTFNGADAFDQPLNDWDVSAVTSLKSTFQVAKAFNQDLNGWDTSAVTNLEFTFFWAEAFTQKLCWDMGAVTEEGDTLRGAPLSASIHQLGSAECAECALTSSATSTVVSTVGALAAVLAAAAVLA